MAFKDTLKTAFLPLAMAASSLIAAPAHAVQMGADGCLPPAELMAQLKAEGQGSVIAGQRVVPKSVKNPQVTTVFAFSTALKSGEFGKGYSFEANKGNGEPDFKLCITGIYDKARGLDVSKKELPAGVAANSNLAKVINIQMTDYNLNPIFYGEKNGAITVVVANPTLQNKFNGVIIIGNNDPKRPADDQGGFIGLGYTPQYIQSLTQTSPPDLKP